MAKEEVGCRGLTEGPLDPHVQPLRPQAAAGRCSLPALDPNTAPTPSTLVMCHCRRRGSQLLLGRECHIHVYEQGGVAQVSTQHVSPWGQHRMLNSCGGNLFPWHGAGTCRGRNGWDGGFSGGGRKESHSQIDHTGAGWAQSGSLYAGCTRHPAAP